MLPPKFSSMTTQHCRFNSTLIHPELLAGYCC